MARATQLPLSCPLMIEVPVIEHEHLQIIERLHTGLFGAVHLAFYKGEKVVFKQLTTSLIRETDKMAGQLKRDAQSQSYEHPNIIKLLAVVFEPRYYGVVMEYAEYGPLDSFVKKHEAFIDLPLIISFGTDIANGMEYLHGLLTPLIHGELRLQNVFVGALFTAKVGDFGLLKWKQYSIRSTGAKSSRGSVTHIPPENWKNINEKWTTKYDVYGFGILLWELLSRKTAFERAPADVVKSNVTGLSGLRRPPIGEIDFAGYKTDKNTRDSLTELIERCWKESHVGRPTFSEIVGCLAILRQHHEGLIEQSKQTLDRNISRRMPTTVQ